MRISDWSSDVCSSDLPGPACYDRGGLKPTVTDADLVLGYLDPKNYANGRIPLNPKRARQAIEDQLCDELDMGVVQAAQLIDRKSACRERVCQYGLISVVAGSFKKKKASTTK